MVADLSLPDCQWQCHSGTGSTSATVVLNRLSKRVKTHKFKGSDKGLAGEPRRSHTARCRDSTESWTRRGAMHTTTTATTTLTLGLASQGWVTDATPIPVSISVWITDATPAPCHQRWITDATPSSVSISGWITDATPAPCQCRGGLQTRHQPRDNVGVDYRCGTSPVSRCCR